MKAAALAALLLASCGENAPAQSASPRAVLPNWKRVATSGDLDRLHKWRTAFVRALSQARAKGHTDEIAAHGALMMPDAALDPLDLKDGTYRCRVIKLGANGSAMRDYTAYPAFDCRVSASRFTKTSGSQRPVGTIYDAGSGRAIFLGTLMLGDETAALAYGRDETRDLAGIFERVGERRWRLLLPYPRFESIIDVIEITGSG